MNRPTTRPVAIPAINATGPVRRPAADITAVIFARVRRFGRGLDPAHVHAYLNRIAKEVAARDAARDRDVAALIEENERLKSALDAWQAAFAPAATPDGYHHQLFVGSSPSQQPPPSPAAGSPLPRRRSGSLHGWDDPTAAHPPLSDPPDCSSWPARGHDPRPPATAPQHEDGWT